MYYMNPTHFYMITKGRYVKVGITSDLGRRLSTYQHKAGGCQYPDDLDLSAPASIAYHCLGDSDTEGLVMALLHKDHAIGEWFHLRGQVAVMLHLVGLGQPIFPGRTTKRYAPYGPPKVLTGALYL